MTKPRYASDPKQRFNGYADFYQNSAYTNFPQEHRSGGSFGVNLMRVEQESIDFIDAAVPDIVFCRVNTSGRGILLDVGDGPTEKEHLGSEITMYPAFSTPRTRVLDPHIISTVNIPIHQLQNSMQDAGIAYKDSIFAPFLGEMRKFSAASRLMDRMWQLLQSPNGIDHLLFDGLTLQFLAEMAAARDLSPLGGARPEDERIARVIDYIEEHFGDSLDIAELAAVSCLSPAHFSRVFKATVGEPVWTYVTRRRCIRAKEKLLNENLSISEIAYRCGFASQSHMTKTLKTIFGITPGEFRQNSKVTD